MRHINLLLFQLFLALFAGYAVLYDVPNEYLLVPLLCLVCMFFLAKHPDSYPTEKRKKLVLDANNFCTFLKVSDHFAKAGHAP